MNIFLKTILLSFVFTLFQLIIIYFPIVFAKKKDRKIIQQIIPFRIIDFTFCWVYMFIVGLFLSFFEMSMINEVSLIYLLEGTIISAFLSSYFFIVYPFIIRLQHKRFIIAKGLQKKYKNTFTDSNISIYTTTFNCANAFAVGFLPINKVIVIGKELFENLSDEEQFAIVCHEEGHHKNNDLFAFWLYAVFAILFFVIGKIYFTQLITIFFPTISKSGISGIWGSIHAFIFYIILFSKISQHAEYRADNYAAQYGGKKNIIAALRKMNDILNGYMENGSITHPKLRKRFENIEKLNYV